MPHFCVQKSATDFVKRYDYVTPGFPHLHWNRRIRHCDCEVTMMWANAQRDGHRAKSNQINQIVYFVWQ